MGKISVILVVLDKKFLDEALGCLNFNAAQLEAVIVEGGIDQTIQLNELSFMLCPFTSLEKFLQNGSDYIWLLNCDGSAPGRIWRFAKFLHAYGVSQDNIVNFIIAPHISSTWLGNIKYIESHQVEYIATGISYTEVGLDLDRITGMHGVNLAGSNQDLRQAFLTAQYVFERQKSIKFVLIGLAPYAFRYDNLESFSVCSRNLQYLLGLKNSRDDSVHGQLLRMLISNNVKRVFTSASEEYADPNFVELKRLVNKEINANLFVNWENELQNLTKEFRAETVAKNLDILEQYIQLCLEHGAKPIGVILPFSPIINRKYPRDLLAMVRRTLEQLSKAYDFKVIDLFELPLGYKHFYNMSHLNLEGARLSSILANYELYRKQLKPIDSMRRIVYDDLYELAFMLSPKHYNQFTSELWKASATHIGRKGKIRIGFVGYDASMWCGDQLYRLFERDERYEATVFLCLRRDRANEPLVVKDFRNGVEQLRARGINVIAVENDDAEIPKQDVLIYMTTYVPVLSKAFQLDRLAAETLIVYVPYAIRTSEGLTNLNYPMMLLPWKIFLETKEMLTFYKEQTRTHLPSACFSGHPKFDCFFDEHTEQFDWKEAQPNSTRIIYAPHWSIDSGIAFATFQWNYEFFYEYAKNHPETSWVFKPHPNLLFSAVKEKVFPSAEAFEEYMRKWDELPNARVVTGGYYQSIFASSDGMILDSCSFITEYQYTHKPQIFLTRESQKFNEFRGELVKLLYRIDGRDFDGISKLIEEVLIAKHDPMSEARREFFDEHLNYVKDNGMTASEYIFNAIDRELREV